MINRILTSIVLLLLVTFSATAQTTATANLTIKLRQVLSIEVLDPNVEFVYNTAASYGEDQTVSKIGHISVISSTKFDLSMKSNTAEFTSLSAETIPVNVVTIGLPNSGSFGGTYSGERILSVTDQILVTDAPLGFRKLLDVNYRIPAAKASSVLLGKPVENYSQVVTYTVTAN